MRTPFRTLAVSSLVACATLAVPIVAHATLKVYYDPLTGNVSFDTTNTRNGEVNHFGLMVTRPAPVEFRTDQLIRLSNSTIFSDKPDNIFDSTQSDGWQGLYTIGNVLPPQLTEQFWTTFFSSFQQIDPPVGMGGHVYGDIVGGGFPPPAEFIYGAPAGQFQNRIDLIDPDSLTWANRATLTYYAATGEVVIDTTVADSGYITGALLESDSAFLMAGFQPSISLGPYSGASDDSIALIVDLIDPGKISLGEILPAGLNAASFEALFNSARFMGRAGFAARQFDFAAAGQDFELAFVAVPEPATCVLAISAVAALGVGVRRQKKSAKQSS